MYSYRDSLCVMHTRSQPECAIEGIFLVICHSLIILDTAIHLKKYIPCYRSPVQ